MKTLLVALLLTLVALAGCASDGDDGGSSSSTTTRTPSSTFTGTSTTTSSTGGPSLDPRGTALLLNFGFTDCQGVFVPLTTTQDAASALLPEGYALDPQGELSSASLTNVYLEFYTCTNLTTPNVQVEVMGYGRTLIPISAPEIAGVYQAADAHYYQTAMVSDEDILRSLWTVAGYTQLQAAIAISVTSPTPLTQSVQAGLGDTTLSGLLTPDGGSDTIRRAYYQDAEKGTLVWHETIEVTAASQSIGILVGGVDAAFLPSPDGSGTLPQSGPQTFDVLSFSTTESNLFLRPAT